jgi:uncharacterized protein
MALRTFRVFQSLALCGLLIAVAAVAAAQPLPPELTQPVNDFAGVVDADSVAAMDSLIRALQKASGDVVVVATIDTFMPYGDIREYAVKMFENHGRGIGQKGKDNGLLILLAVKDRQVWVEVGYDLEEFITDGFAGETSRKVMAPEFRRGAYGAGLAAGLRTIVGRIAERRNVTLEGVTRQEQPQGDDVGFGGSAVVFLILLFILLNMIGRTRRRRRFWGMGPWSGWNSGVGPFGGGGFGGGLGGGGGFGGGFGGFGGGRSGGGGGGASW